MTNGEHYEPDPFDEEVVRVDMRDVCSYDHSSEDASNFMVQKAEPALSRFCKTQQTIEIEGGNLPLHEGAIKEPDRVDVYNMQSVGIHTTTRRVDFYYYFYAMTAPVTSPPTPEKVYSSPYCVISKASGRYRPILDHTITIEGLFEDIKKAFDKART